MTDLVRPRHAMRKEYVLSLIDTKEKPYTCGQCPKAFTRKYACLWILMVKILALTLSEEISWPVMSDSPISRRSTLPAATQNRLLPRIQQMA